MASADHLEHEPTRKVRVRICGITNPDDAAATIAFGADALGYNCYAKVSGIVSHDRYTRWLRDAPETEKAGEAELIIAKQRNGPTGNIPLTFRKEFTRFADRAREEREPL